MLWRRISRSLHSRGIVGSLDCVFSKLQERFFDLRYGTDTVSFAELDTLTVSSEHVGDGTPYQPTRLRLVRQVLSSLDIAPGSAFVDFGCGKGRVLLLAADYGFRRITGVDFAKELCAIARDNVARYRRKTSIQADIRIVEGDAVEYEIRDDENVFFMSNPFSAALVEKVTKTIVRSLRSRNRPGLIIYNNPLWSEAIERQGFAPLLNFNTEECVIYRYDAEPKAERRRIAA
jgi:SAM-dependent methyltransferase